MPAEEPSTASGADGIGRFREAACWAHWRRDFHDIWTSNKSEIAREALDRIGALYDIERDIAGQPADIRLAARQKHSKAKVEALRVWAEAQLTRIPGKGDLASAFRYGLSRWHSFCLFLEDGRVAMDNNVAERALRPIGGPESLCTPSLSVCKHWKRLRVSNATRAALSGYRSLDRRRSQVAGPDLIRRAGNHLLGRQHVRLDKVAYSVVRHAQSRRRLCHGKPFALFIG
jgi:transposase